MSKAILDNLKALTFRQLSSPSNSGLVVNEALTGSVAEILLYRPIGSVFEGGVDGALIAAEIDYLQNYVETIVIRVNTYGGSILDGMSIMAAMQRSKAKIICIIDGVAASIGGVIAICASETYIVDYGLVMIHGANFSSGTGDSAILEKFNESLSTIWQKRLNKTPEQVAEFFQVGKEIWLDAEEALQAGIVTGIIETNARELVNEAKAILTNDLQENAMLSHVLNFYNTHQTSEKQMTKEVLNALELAEASTAKDVVNAIGSLRNQLTAKELQVSTLQAEVTNKATEIQSLTNKIAEFEAAETAAKEKAAKDLVADAVKTGKIANSAESIAKWEKLAKSDLALAQETINALAATPKLSNLTKGDKEDEAGAEKFQPVRIANIMADISKKHNA